MPAIDVPPGGPAADAFGTRLDGLGQAPDGSQHTSVLGSLRQVQRPGGPGGPGGARRPRSQLILAAAGTALVLVTAGYFLLKPSSGGTATGSPVPTASATKAATSKSPAARRQAATRLSLLLAQSVSDRGAVVNAVVDVRGCGQSLPQDAQVFGRAASSRYRMLAELKGLHGRSLLSETMLRDLAGAWRASAQADTDLARWADAKITHGCHRRASDASLRASYGPDGRATIDKQAFAGMWDSVARRYGLTVYQWTQL